MKPNKNKDYKKLTAIAKKLGFVPHKKMPGFYHYKESMCAVDLTACAEDEISILKTSLLQLSESLDDMCATYG